MSSFVLLGSALACGPAWSQEVLRTEGFGGSLDVTSMEFGGDIDGDGVADLAFSLFDSSGTADFLSRIYSGLDGALILEISDVGDPQFATEAGDLDGDGRGDLLVVYYFDSRVRAFSGASGVELYEITTCGLGCSGFGSAATALGDIDQDGRDDFAVGSSGGAGQVSVFSGNFGVLLHSFPAGDAVQQLDGSRDFDGDGSRDLVVGMPWTGRLNVHSGISGNLLASAQGPQGLGSEISAVGDMTGDGVPEVAASGRVGSGDDGWVSLRDGSDLGVLWNVPGATASRFGSSLAWIDDLDGDGVSDLIVGAPDHVGPSSPSRGRVSVLSGADGSLVHEWFGKFGEGLGTHAVVLDADLDGQGGSEFVLVSEGAPRARLYSHEPMGQVICGASASSTGQAAQLTIVGSRDVDRRYLQFIARPVPAEGGLFFYGTQTVNVPFGDGLRCVGGYLSRLAVHPDPQQLTMLPTLDGILAAHFDFAQPFTAQGAITAGSTWYFQAWFRDLAAGGAGYNTSTAVGVTFLQ